MKLKVKVDNQEYETEVEELGSNKLKIKLGDETHEVETSEVYEGDDDEQLEDVELGASNVIKAPMPGTISAIKVKKGDSIKKGDIVVTLIAMKMENQISASKDGKVKDVKVKINDNVEADQVMMVLEE